MKKYSIKYLVSAVVPNQWPVADRPEVVLVGRSNAGKSSLINALWGRPVAFVSGTPGKTNVLNFYDVGEKYRVVDSPGYGFAKKRAEIEAGFKGIEIYLQARQILKGLVLIVDVKRKWEAEEQWLLEFCERNGINMVVALNKIDKLNQKERNQQKKAFEASSPGLKFFMVSAENKEGIEELEHFIFNQWVKGGI